MAKVSEEISKYKANSSAKTDSNIANDSLHLGGIEADEYATKDYVQKYHDTKEEKLKQNISEQDKVILEEAKAYSDEIVNNQDFSRFAKVTDVQAIDSKLSQRIANQETEQKSYTDGKIQGVVNDVNSNFDNVGKSIESLNNTTNQLFQSVSDGKTKVAAAITDKGVDTASNASFEDMANNIKNISSSGGDIPTDPNFVNTGDATAEASDIKVGKSAYSKGNKIYGTYVEKDSTTGVPTYGTDTSGATATANDIAFGKTAWANGQLLVGNMQNSVQEVYAPENENYILTPMNSKLSISQDGTEISSRTILTYSKNLDYCVSVVKLNNDVATYIESNLITSKGLVVQASAGENNTITYKKYRYTYEELGLESTEKIKCATLGFPGLDNNPKKCLLLIVTTGYDANIKIHFYTYHLCENGQIGKMYENESNVIFNYIYNIPLSTISSSFTTVSSSNKCFFSILSSNLKYDKFIISTIYYTKDSGNGNVYTKAILLNFSYNIIISTNQLQCMVSNRTASSAKGKSVYLNSFQTVPQPYWSSNDTWFTEKTFNTLESSSTGNLSAKYYIQINTSDEYSIQKEVISNYYDGYNATYDVEFYKNYMIAIYSRLMYIYTYTNLNTPQKIIQINYSTSSNSYSEPILLKADTINKKIFVLRKKSFFILDLENIEEIANNQLITPIQDELLYGDTFDKGIASSNASLIIFENETGMGKAEANGTQKVIGVIYKGKQYYLKGEA